MEEKKRKHPMETNGKNLIGTPRTYDATRMEQHRSCESIEHRATWSVEDGG